MSIKLKCIYLLFAAIAVISLLFAYFVEYVMGYAPCILCVYQRFPFLIFMVVGIIGLASSKWENGLFYLMLSTICNIMLAGYHTGLELGYFELSSFCKPLITISDNLSVSDFRNMLYSNEMPLCNKPSLFILGLTMTQWNLLLNIGLFTILILALQRRAKHA